MRAVAGSYSSLIYDNRRLAKCAFYCSMDVYILKKVKKGTKTSHKTWKKSTKFGQQTLKKNDSGIRIGLSDI